MRTCPACGRRLFLAKSSPKGKVRYCPKGHVSSDGAARPEIRLVLGKLPLKRRVARRIKRIFDA